MVQRIPLTLFGTGLIARNGYLPHLTHGPFEVVSFYDPNPDAVEKLAPFLPRARVATSEQACIETPAAAVLISSSSPTHVELSLRALRSGRHVLCEKPVAIHQSQVEELLRAEREGSKRL